MRAWSFVFFMLSTVPCLLSTVFSCGYALHSKTSLPFRSIRIGEVENRTVEPKLQDKLSRALVDELLRQGVAVDQGADYHLTGRIDQFSLRVLSEVSDIATEYEVVIKGNFVVTDPSGQRRELRDIGSPFIVSLSGSGELTPILARKELAVEKAVQDMARQIVAALVYR